MAIRLGSHARQNVIENAAVIVAIREQSISAITFDAVAEECEIETSVATIRWYYRSINDLRIAAAARNEAVKALAEKSGMSG